MNSDFYTCFKLAESMIDMSFMSIYMIGSHFDILDDSDIHKNTEQILEKVFIKMYNLGRFKELIDFVKVYKRDV